MQRQEQADAAQRLAPKHYVPPSSPSMHPVDCLAKLLGFVTAGDSSLGSAEAAKNDKAVHVSNTGRG